MRQSTPGSFLLALVLLSAGCSGGKSSRGNKEPEIGPDVKGVDSPVSLYRASTELANALADVLAEIKDSDTAKSAEPKLRVLTRKAKILAAKSKDLKFDERAPGTQPLPNAKDEEDFAKARRRAEAEVKRIRADPELDKLLKAMDLQGLYD